MEWHRGRCRHHKTQEAGLSATLRPNHILYADSEEALRQIVADFVDKHNLERYFVYGYGSHHLWLKQRKITNPEMTFEYRVLIVEC